MSYPACKKWYHCTVSTYGTWLPGDPRGWRERDHHEHVDGDYKSPPKETKFNQGLHARSKGLLRGEPYIIQKNDRETIGRLLLENFARRRIPILALAVCAKNFHAFLQAADDNPKKWLGLAKRHVTFSFAPFSDETTKERVPIWEGEGGAKPIHDRAHGVRAYHYILDHVNDGGWVWSYKELASERNSPRAVADGGL